MRLSTYLLSAFLVVTAPAVATAQWIIDGVVVNDSPGSISGLRTVSDGAGGAIILWLQPNPPLGSEDIYGQRIGTSGTLLWELNGDPLVAEPNRQSRLEAVADGVGGVVAVWEDQRSSESRVYALRIDAAGNVLWPTGGVLLSGLAGDHVAPRVVAVASDFVVTWQIGSGKIYAQRLDQNGNKLWSANGVPVSSASGQQLGPQVIEDENDGVIVVWNAFSVCCGDATNGWDVRAQRLDAAGAPLWAAGGVPVVAMSGDESLAGLAGDGAGGVIASWWRQTAEPGGDAQRIDASGTALWGADGVSLKQPPGPGLSPAVVSDGMGGAIFAWVEQDLIHEIRVQKVDPSGNPVWSAEGVKVNSGNDPAEFALFASDGVGGAIVMWQELWDIHAQRIGSNGELLWPLSFVTGALGDWGGVMRLTQASDGAVVLTWIERRKLVFDSNVYAQKLYLDGTWARPDPAIVEIADVPDDEGGMLRIHLSPSAYDAGGVARHPVVGYNVWRLVKGSPAAAAAPLGDDGGAHYRRFLTERASGTHGSFISSREEARALGLLEGEWESIGFHAATGSASYDFVVPTSRDFVPSVPSADYTWVYAVTAHTTDPFTFFTSDPDTGFSVDNLPPTIPIDFTAELNGSEIKLSWQQSTERDLAYYSVHVGDSADFVPSPENLVATTQETMLTFDAPVPFKTEFLKLSAVDRHENKSEYAVTSTGGFVAALIVSHHARFVDDYVELSWKMIEAASHYEYVVQRSESGGPYEDARGETEINGPTVVFRDRLVSAGQSYTYHVSVLESDVSVAAFVTEIRIPSLSIGLEQNHPNPFGLTTEITYRLAKRASMNLSVYDAQGRLVRTIRNGIGEPGDHVAVWDGTDDHGIRVSSGVYFYRLNVQGRLITKRMVTLR